MSNKIRKIEQKISDYPAVSDRLAPNFYEDMEGWVFHGANKTKDEQNNLKDQMNNSIDDINNALDEIEQTKNYIEDNKTNIDNVVSNKTNINKTVENEDNINKVANLETSITKVVNNEDNINSVVNNEANINKVASNKTNIDKASNNESNINKVVELENNISKVINNEDNINSVVNNEVNINKVASNKTNIDKTSNNEANINKVVELEEDITKSVENFETIENDIKAAVTITTSKTNEVLQTKKQIDNTYGDFTSVIKNTRYKSGWAVVHPLSRQLYPSEMFEQTDIPNTLRFKGGFYDFSGEIKYIYPQDIVFGEAPDAILTTSGIVTAKKGEYIISKNKNHLQNSNWGANNSGSIQYNGGSIVFTSNGSYGGTIKRGVLEQTEYYEVYLKVTSTSGGNWVASIGYDKLNLKVGDNRFIAKTQNTDLVISTDGAGISGSVSINIDEAESFIRKIRDKFQCIEDAVNKPLTDDNYFESVSYISNQEIAYIDFDSGRWITAHTATKGNNLLDSIDSTNINFGDLDNRWTMASNVELIDNGDTVTLKRNAGGYGLVKEVVGLTVGKKYIVVVPKIASGEVRVYNNPNDYNSSTILVNTTTGNFIITSFIAERTNVKIYLRSPNLSAEFSKNIELKEWSDELVYIQSLHKVDSNFSHDEVYFRRGITNSSNELVFGKTWNIGTGWKLNSDGTYTALNTSDDVYWVQIFKDDETEYTITVVSDIKSGTLDIRRGWNASVGVLNESGIYIFKGKRTDNDTLRILGNAFTGTVHVYVSDSKDIESGVYYKDGKKISHPIIWQTLNQGGYSLVNERGTLRIADDAGVSSHRHEWFKANAKKINTMYEAFANREMVYDSHTHPSTSGQISSGIGRKIGSEYYDQIALNQILFRPSCNEGHNKNWKRDIINGSWEWGIEGIPQTIHRQNPDNSKVQMQIVVDTLFYFDAMNGTPIKENDLPFKKGKKYTFQFNEVGSYRIIETIYTGTFTNGGGWQFKILRSTSSLSSSYTHFGNVGVYITYESDIIYRDTMPMYEGIGNPISNSTVLKNQMIFSSAYALNLLMTNQDNVVRFPDSAPKAYIYSRKAIDNVVEVKTENSGTTYDSTTRTVDKVLNQSPSLSYPAGANIYHFYNAKCSIYSKAQSLENIQVDDRAFASNHFSLYKGSSIFEPLGVTTGTAQVESKFLENNEIAYDFKSSDGVQSVKNGQTILCVKGFKGTDGRTEIGKVYQRLNSDFTADLNSIAYADNANVSMKLLGYTSLTPKHNTFDLDPSGYIAGKAMFMTGTVDKTIQAQVILNQMFWDKNADNVGDTKFGTITTTNSFTYKKGHLYKLQHESFNTLENKIIEILSEFTVSSSQIANYTVLRDGSIANAGSPVTNMRLWDGNGFGDSNEFEHLSPTVYKDDNLNDVRVDVKNIILDS